MFFSLAPQPHPPPPAIHAPLSHSNPWVSVFPSTLPKYSPSHQPLSPSQPLSFPFSLCPSSPPLYPHPCCSHPLSFSPNFSLKPMYNIDKQVYIGTWENLAVSVVWERKYLCLKWMHLKGLAHLTAYILGLYFIEGIY